MGLIGCLWTAIVAFSRLRMGAHFLTDVTMAWLVTLGLTVLGVYLFYFNKKFFQFVWNLISERESRATNRSSVCSEGAVHCVGVDAYIDPANRTVFTEICGEDDISPEAMPTSPLRISVTSHDG